MAFIFVVQEVALGRIDIEDKKRANGMCPLSKGFEKLLHYTSHWLAFNHMPSPAASKAGEYSLYSGNMSF